MQVYIFISEKDPSLRVFTWDETGANLPAESAPWRAANGGQSLFLASASDPIAREIRAVGYHLVDARPLKTAASNYSKLAP
jgi:hypothetical protein